MPVLALAETITQRPGVSTPLPAAGASETIGLEPAAKETGTPRHFARYEIIREIGRGAFGIVYRARDPQLGRDVALKVLIAGEQAGESLIKRFHAEAQAAAKLRHPNIVPIHDVGIHDGKHYFTADFIEGTTLETLLKQRLTTTQIVKLMTEIASALQHAHEHGIVHRDIKPGNVLIDASGRAMVTDFGLARNVEVESSLTRSGDVVGTPAYMSPEQAAGRTADVEERSDVYALGVLLYEMLTGRLPFQSDSLVALLRAVIEDEPVPPRKLNPKVDRDLETICLKCLEKEKARRYRTAAALVEDLKRFSEGEPLAARPPSFTYRWRKRLWKHRAWTLGLTAAAVALIVALGLGLGLFERLARFAAGWELVVDEEFSSGVLPEGWEVVAGRAEVVDGALVAEAEMRNLFILLPAACPDAVRLEYDAWFPVDVEFDKACELSCFLHCDRDHVGESGYMLEFGCVANKCSSVYRNDAELLGNTTPQALIVPGRRHHVVAEHAGEYVTLTVDGRSVLRLRDFFPLSGGRAGLYSFGKGAHFDNVKLWRRKKALDVSSLAVPDKLFLKGDYKEAIAEYDAIHASHPSEPEGRLALYKSGLARMAVGDLQGARQAFEGLSSSDLRGWAHMGLAESEARNGRGAGAAEELRKAENAGNAEIAALVQANTVRIAFEALNRADLAAAMPLLRKARHGLREWELDRLARTVYVRGASLATRGEYDAVIAFSQAVVAIFPDSREWCAQASLCSGWVLKCTGLYEDAARELESVASVYPEQRRTCASAQVLHGETLADMGRFGNAISAYDKGQVDYPEERGLCAFALVGSGLARLSQHDHAGAEADWRKILREYANENNRAVRLARFFLGEIEETAFLKDLKREARSDWNDDTWRIAEKHHAAGNLAEAARWYRKSLELTVGDEWPAVLARKRLKEIEEKLKAPAEAPAKADGR